MATEPSGKSRSSLNSDRSGKNRNINTGKGSTDCSFQTGKAYTNCVNANKNRNRN